MDQYAESSGGCTPQMEETMEPIKDASHLYEVRCRGIATAISKIRSTSSRERSGCSCANRRRRCVSAPAIPILFDPAVRTLLPMGGMTQQRSSCFKASASTIMSRSWRKAEPAQPMLRDSSNAVALTRCPERQKETGLSSSLPIDFCRNDTTPLTSADNSPRLCPYNHSRRACQSSRVDQVFDVDIAPRV